MFLLLCSGSVAAQQGTISGRVLDATAGQPLAAVHVTVQRGEAVVATTQSGPDGQYRVAGLPAGTYVVVARHIGYTEARFANVAVGAGATVVLPLSLQALPIAIPGVVVTGGRQVEDYMQSPTSIAVVSSERAEERIALQPTEHLKGLPGVDFAQTGVFTSVTVVRGFSNIFSTSLLTIMDHRFTNVPSLRVNTSVLMPALTEDIERIELLLGPGAALYGPNAANGVMHIITQSPLTRPGTTVSASFGERSVLSGSLRHAGVVNDRFGYKFTGQWMQATEWPGADPEEIRVRDPDLSRWSGEVRGDYRIADNSELTVNVGRATATTAIELTPFGAAQARGWDLTYAQARLRANRLFVQVFTNMSDAGDTYLLRTGAPIVDESRLFAAQAQHSTPLGERQSFTYGLDFARTDPRTGGTIHGRFEDDDDSNEIGAYLVSETRLTPQLNLILASRLDHHSRFDDLVLSPRAAIVYSPTPNQAWRAAYNRAYGTPLNSQLFLDLQAGTIGPLPFQVRAIGAIDGFRFGRDCPGGLCMRSPFPAAGEGAPNPGQMRGIDATRFWGTATALLFQMSGGQIDIRGIPAPSATQVTTALRMLNPNPAGPFFETVSATSLQDVPALVPSISNSFEVGYKGVLGGRVLLGVDVWHLRRDNFINAGLIETPNVFFERNSLAAYLANFMNPLQAGQIAAVMAGIDGSPAQTGIPVGTVGFEHAFTHDPNVYVVFRNFGDVQLWGSDLALEAHVVGDLSATGTYSWVSDDTFRTIGADGSPEDIVLNAPKNKGSLGLRWGPRDGPVTLNSLARFVDGFPMASGVYVGNVESYAVFDLGATFRLPQAPGARLTVQAQNLFDRDHRPFIGSPNLGRLVTARIMYSF